MSHSNALRGGKGCRRTEVPVHLPSPTLRWEMSGPFRAGVHGAPGSPRRCLGLSHFAALRREPRPPPKGPRRTPRTHRREEMDLHSESHPTNPTPRRGPMRQPRATPWFRRDPTPSALKGRHRDAPFERRVRREEMPPNGGPGPSCHRNHSPGRTFHRLPCGGECPAPSGPGSMAGPGPQGVALGYRISPLCGGNCDLPRRGP
jgi:hypothetical protein